MNKTQAIAHMKKGEKVTHTNFTSSEWVTSYGSKKLQFEDGVKVDEEEFFNSRSGASWDYGWSIFCEDK